MKRLFAIFLLVCFVGYSPASPAATPKNALGAIAVSPDGKTVFAAGDNRVLYVLDAEKMSVQKRVWIGINPLSITFSSDGSTFVLHDTKGSLRFYNASTYQMTSEVTGAMAMAVAEKADIIFAAGRPSGRGSEVKTSLRGYSLVTGKPILDKAVNAAILGIGVDTDARRIFAISKQVKNPSEPVQKTPSTLRSVERETFRQKNDGKTADFIAFDVNGNELGRHTSWFSSASPVTIVSAGNALRVMGFNNMNAHITLGSMETKIFRNKNNFNYGIGYSIENNRIVTGGLARGSITTVDNGQVSSFSISKIGGWPEYFRGFSIAKDGTIYGGTTAYRLVRIGADGAVKAVPVY